MKQFSNKLFIQAVMPQNSQTTSQSGRLLGFALAGMSVAAIVFICQYHNFSRQLQAMKKKNEILAGQLEAALAATVITEDEVPDEPDSQDEEG